jgi:redox-sensitive bicupin YhaK (pirin superfamily)
VTGADVEPRAATGHADADAVEVMDSRSSTVGFIPVLRALPQRSRRTVGSWCFLDVGGPLDAGAGSAGIGPHPHIGLQTVTWMLAGELLHRDSLGSEQVIRPGQLNLMTAGRGIVHAEEHPRAGPVHIAQLWVAQPAATRDGPPAFEHHAVLPQLEFEGATATVLLGGLGDARSPARRDTDHVGVDLALRSDTTLPGDIRYEYAVVPLDGPVDVGGRTVAPGQLVYVGTGRDELHLRVLKPVRVLVLGGVPFDEPILMWWNYVARTRDEIADAHREWTARGDRFVVPHGALEPIDVGPPPWAGAEQD